MGYLEGFRIKKADGGLGRTEDTADNVFLLVGAIPTTGTQLTADKAELLIQLKDAEALGITESFDANNHTLAHHHLSEVFRLAPACSIYFLPVEAGVKLQDKAEVILKTLRGNSDIKGIAAFGFDNDLSTVAADVDQLQTAIIDAVKKDGILIDFLLLEGKGKEGLAINSLPNLKEKAAPQVSVVIAQDSAIAALSEHYKYYAAIGAALGMLAVRNVSESLGSVDIETKPEDAKGGSTYPLTDTGRKRFISASISTGVSTDALSNEQLKLLKDRGYIIAGSYPDTAGIYFSAAPTCTSKASDYSYIQNNRVWNKAVRILRRTTTPRIQAKLPKDPTTGYLKDTTVTALQELASKAIEKQMLTTGEIDGLKVSISPKQVVDEDKPLVALLRIVMPDILYIIEGNVGLTNKL